MSSQPTFRFNKSHWKDFSSEDLQVIERERSQRGTITEFSSKHQYGKICPACTKPNSVNVDFCTGCSFPLTPQDVSQLPDNVFLDIITGKNKDTPILFRDDSLCLFNDKFGVSVHNDHIDIIPIDVYDDVTCLTQEHIPMLEALFKAGVEEFKKRDLSRFGENFNIEENVIAGYNYPVSVKHLHLHMVLPPFKHHKVFQYPRWHSHAKIINDLKIYGKVRTYDQYPNDEEGAREYARAINLHNTVSETKFDPNWKNI
ncbi:hypothetical protein FDP41_004134 [Naegleria fowleri]|uniref:HIT domain-containing protein n=1 Tax=Naegleria fowleri TaxID=5763 RepID=A0A6A5BV82_NAEFO|nr:uncharacterized protein FDP41_004134 [Naegleria fowleri]KAF0976839.1 hypothetical protein FDP41_004134 [Naegleria fowleri]CAG4709899.1 unnamed protein product [Naegleria fowleri]